MSFFNECESLNIPFFSHYEHMIEYTQNLSGRLRTVKGVVLPNKQVDVEKIVELSNKYNISLYPFSGGFNWGLGCKLPVKNDSILVDLKNLNSVINIDPEYGTVTLEPGVTLEKIVNLIQNTCSEWYLPCTGAPPKSSIIGNMLDRGDGLGPGGIRTESCCELKIVLGNGKTITTGYGDLDTNGLSRLTQIVLGPSIQGLFYQSNFGIVVQATFWLKKKYKYFQPFLIPISNNLSLHKLMNSLRMLQCNDHIQENSWAIWNNYKMIASEMQFPWSTQSTFPLFPNDLLKIKSQWGNIPWVCFGALYSRTQEHAKADEKVLKKTMRSIGLKPIIFSSKKIKWIKLSSYFLNKRSKNSIKNYMDSLVEKSVFHGHPTYMSSRTLYWRKKEPIPLKLDPISDQCGLIWICATSKFDPHLIIKISKKISEKILSYGFEPHIAFISPSDKNIFYFPSIIFDKNNNLELEKAKQCEVDLMETLVSLGAIPYRLGIDSMFYSYQIGKDYQEILKSLKLSLDPKGVISPGRYIEDFHHEN